MTFRKNGIENGIAWRMQRNIEHDKMASVNGWLD